MATNAAADAITILNPLQHVEKLEDTFLADDTPVRFARLSYRELAMLQDDYPILNPILEGKEIDPGQIAAGMDDALRVTVIALAVAKFANALDSRESILAIAASVRDMAEVERDGAFVAVMTHSFPALRKAFREALAGGASEMESPALGNRLDRKAAAAKARKSPSSKRSASSRPISASPAGTRTPKASPRTKSGKSTSAGSSPGTGR